MSDHRQGLPIELARIENVEAIELIGKIIVKYGAEAAMPMFVAVAEMVADGELTDGPDLVEALRALLEDEDEEAAPSPEVLRETAEQAMDRLNNRTPFQLVEDGYDSAATFRLMLEHPDVKGDPQSEAICAHDIREAQPLSPYRRASSMGPAEHGQTIILCKTCYDARPDGVFMPMLEVSSGAVCRSCGLNAVQVIERDGVTGWRRPASEGGGPWWEKQGT